MSAFRLVFLLPAALVLRAPAGRLPRCLSGCSLDVDRNARVTVQAPSRLQAFEQARAWLTRIAKDAPAQCIAAELTTPAGYYGANARGGRDPVWIVVNAEVSFFFGGIEPAIDAGARHVA